MNNGFVMSTKVAVINATPIPPRSSRMIIDALRNMGVEVKYVPLQYLGLLVGEEESRICLGKDFLELEGGILRGIGSIVTVEQFFARVAILKFLEERGIYLMNSLQSLISTRNKLETLITLYRKGIPVPFTIVSENLRFLYDTLKEKGINDFVLKPIMGSRGYGSIRIQDVDILFQVGKTLLSNNLPPLIQRYVDKPKRDIRAFVIGDEVVAAMYRYSEKSWKTNIAQGAIGIEVKLKGELEELAIKSTKTLSLEYAGVDIVEENDRYYVLEINGSPDFEGLMKVTGIDIPEKIAVHFLSKLRR